MGESIQFNHSNVDDPIEHLNPNALDRVHNVLMEYSKLLNDTYHQADAIAPIVQRQLGEGLGNQLEAQLKRALDNMTGVTRTAVNLGDSAARIAEIARAAQAQMKDLSGHLSEPPSWPWQMR